MAGSGFLQRLSRNRASADVDPLAAVPLFAALTPETRARVRKRLGTRSVSEGKRLFHPGEPADALYVVERGRFRVALRDPLGQERVLHFVGPGEVLGEAAFMAESIYTTTASATVPARAWRLARADFDDVLAREPAALQHLASVVAQRQAQANARLAAQQATDDPAAERGFVTAVYSPRGGAGVTTLASLLAMALAERHPDDVVLLDLDPLFGHALTNLWLQPRGVLAQVPFQTLFQLDRQGLDYYLRPHESSLRVFPAAQRPEEGEQVSAEHVRAAIGVLKRHFGHIVVDLPHAFVDVTLTGLELADRILFLATPELATLRDVVQSRRIFADLLRLPDERLRYLLNHPSPYVGLPLADFAAATGVSWETVEHGGEDPTRAAVRGESLLKTRPGNPVARAAAREAAAVTLVANEHRALVGR